MRKVKKWHHLNPRTAVSPITLSEFVVRERRKVPVQWDRFTPEYKEWWMRIEEKEWVKEHRA